MTISLDEFSAQIFHLADLQTLVRSVGEIVKNIQSNNVEFRLETEFLKGCEEAKTNLNTEHRAHTEELRLINQDINHLEDMVKTTKSGQKARKSELVIRWEHLNQLKATTDRLLSETCSDITPTVASIEVPHWIRHELSTAGPGSTTTSPHMLFAQPYRLLMLQGPVQLQPNLNPMSAIVPSTWNSRLMADNPVTRTCDDPSKLKRCLFCNYEIHRNSPTCPFCKTKSVSKHPRKRRSNSRT